MAAAQSSERSFSDEPLIAVFVDFENVAIGARDLKGGFEVSIILKRLLEKGRIVWQGDSAALQADRATVQAHLGI